ncbi:MAG: hypothetical protein IT371_21220 [Deltaproteobacteria bacterium]|nr:hypothetical protein [Deltaproteobacteria bacterium]
MPRLLLVFALGLLGRTSYAQSLDDAPTGAAQLALAGGGVAALLGPSGLFTNPASAPGDLRLSATLGLSVSARTVLPRPNALNLALPEARDGSAPRVSPSLALAQPLGRRGLWLLAGYRFGLDVDSRYFPPTVSDTPDPLRYVGPELALHQHVFAAGLAFSRRHVTVGASLELGPLSLSFRRTMWVGLSDDRAHVEETHLDLEARVRLSGFGATGRVGLLVRPARWLRLALSARAPLHVAFSGTVEFSGPRGAPLGYRAVRPGGESATLGLTLPLELVAGLAVEARRWLVVHLASTLSTWGLADDPEVALADASLTLVRSAGAPDRRPLPGLPLGLRLRHAFGLQAGVELPLLDGFLVLRAAWAFQRGASDPSAPSATLLDLDRHRLGLGLAVAAGRVHASLGVQHTFDASLTAGDDALRLFNPLDPAIATVVGRGRYVGGGTRLGLELGVGW